MVLVNSYFIFLSGKPEYLFIRSYQLYIFIELQVQSCLPFPLLKKRFFSSRKVTGKERA